MWWTMLRPQKHGSPSPSRTRTGGRSSWKTTIAGSHQVGHDNEARGLPKSNASASGNERRRWADAWTAPHFRKREPWPSSRPVRPTCGAPVAWIVHGPHSLLNVNCPDRCVASTDIGYARKRPRTPCCGRHRPCASVMPSGRIPVEPIIIQLDRLRDVMNRSPRAHHHATTRRFRSTDTRPSRRRSHVGTPCRHRRIL